MLLLACAGPAPEGDGPPAAAPEAVLDGEAVVYVGTAVTLDAGGSVGDTFTWDFGDGSGAEGATVTHTWTEPGRHPVRLTASVADGRTDTASATWVAVHPPLATPPTASGRLVQLDGVLYAALPDADRVVVVADGAVVDRLATCGRPVSVSAAAGVLAVA